MPGIGKLPPQVRDVLWACARTLPGGREGGGTGRKPQRRGENIGLASNRRSNIDSSKYRKRLLTQGGSPSIISSCLSAKNPGTEFASVLFRLLDQYTRPEDRWLFEFLPPREAPAETSEAAE
jgi:hypothetical protein